MQPNDPRPVTVPPRDTPAPKPDRNLAVALMREQIDRLYSETPAAQPASDPDEVYEKTHDNTTVHPVRAADWQQYHTAWQQYYQQYYDRYYQAKAHEREQRQQASQATAASSTQFPATAPAAADGNLTRDKALDEIRSDLLGKIQQQSSKIRKNRHFVPILSALAVMVIFLFLQYNRLIFAQVKAYISPGSINPQNIILDADTTTAVSAEPRLIIPKINVDAPVVYGLTSLAEPTVQDALKNGVIHYPIPGANANPGEKGNGVFLGHSSNDVFDDGNYKFIFVQLEQLTKGDRFYLNYNKTRYTYIVTSTETILPTEVSKLVTQDTRPTVSLVTCTPVGTAQKRFIVHADQISPDPTAATAASPQAADSGQPSNISGNSPTLFDRLFGF